ncbi:MAG TPA: hypothetical protein VF221_02560 [Chloroflexota bacterium]
MKLAQALIGFNNSVATIMFYAVVVLVALLLLLLRVKGWLPQGDRRRSG